MSQKSITTTTSFIVSSDESLNKPPFSSSQSTDSSEHMTTSDSIHINQYSSATVNPSYHTMINQQHQLNGSLLQTQPILQPSPPPPLQASLQGQYYADSNFDQSNSMKILQQQQQSSIQLDSQNQTNPSLNQFNDAQPNGLLYGTYHNNLQASSLVQQPLPPLQTTNGPASLLTNGQALKLSPMTHLFQQQQKHSPSNQRSSTSSLDSASSTSMMPINVKGMLLHGLSSDEVLRNWLASIKCEDYLKNFVEHGYDIHIVTRMTPQDLAAIGCKSPALRKKLLSEIKKLNLDDDIPKCCPPTLDKWLEILKLGQYYPTLISEGFDTVEKVCQLTWEDLEEIGINKLGHQKRLLIGIERVLKLIKQQEERQNDNAIYDVHPNHRISLNGTMSESRLGTLGRVRSGFFQTRSGASLDHRGLPVATVMPALKHVNSSLMSSDSKQHQVITQSIDSTKINNTQTYPNGHNSNNRLSMCDPKVQLIYESNQEQVFKMSDLAATLKRNPPPLPPVRTNSLKISNGLEQRNSLNGQAIYGNNYGISSVQNGSIQAPTATNATSFLRTPKLGTLTATTNKMLTLGGHIQTLNGQATTMRSIVPVREAPLPPIQQHPTIPENIDEESTSGASMTHPQQNGLSITLGCDGGANSQLIGHQLASADEFPPPPPCQ